ncbi:MAG: hypothetical protein ACKOYN_05135 [Planctomycetota bacterium]
MKKQRRTKVSRKQAAPKGGRRGAAALSGVPTEALAAELKRRRSELPRLEKAARELRARLAEVEARIASLGGESAGAAPGAGGSARAAGFLATRGGKPTLALQILEQLRGAAGPLARGQIVSSAARGLGREVTTGFSVQVSATLRKLVNAGEAEQAGRGMYAAKGMAHASAE